MARGDVVMGLRQIVKDNAFFRECVLFDDGLGCILLDPANEMLFISLPLVEMSVRLITAIHDSGFTFAEYLFHKGTFTLFAVAQVYQRFQLVIKIHLQWPVSFGLKGLIEFQHFA